MSREEILKKLNSLHHKILNTSFAEKVSEAEMLALVDAKEILENQQETDWISVEETLPESYEYVLVWCKGNFVGGTHEGEETEWYGIGILCNNRWTIYQCKDIKNIEVIAWQPLPQPYKKEGAENEC